MEADELERLAATGLITAGQADSARRVDDAIASTALGKLVCIGVNVRELLPGYAQAVGLTAASDEVMARAARPALSEGVLDGLAALPAAPTTGRDGTIEIVVASAEGAARLVELPLPPHRVLVADEPRVMALLDRLLGADGAGHVLGAEGAGHVLGADGAGHVLGADGAGAPSGDPDDGAVPFVDDADLVEAGPPESPPPREAPAEETSPTAKAQRWLARPVREIDRREKRDVSGPIAILPPQPSPPPSPAPASTGASGASPVPRREVPPPAAKPRPGMSVAARAIIAVALIVVGAAGIVVARMDRKPDEAVVVDVRGPALAEGQAKERAGEFAWAVAAYSKVVADPRRDDDTAEALLGRARSNIVLGDRVAALADIALVTDGAFASAALKAKAEALRATMH